jgi:hypothetical protein
MNRTQWAAAVVLCASLWACGCSSDEPAAAEEGQGTAYICTETSDVFAVSGDEPKAVNPQTGRRTLAPAMYCESCQKWYPAPPLETLQRTPGASLCPKTGQSMAVAGPLPTLSAN